MAEECTCGIGSGKKCSMKECVEKKQVRYWGVKKVDSKILDTAQKNKNATQERKVLFIKKVKLQAQIKGLYAKAKAEKDKDKREEMKKELQKLMSTFETVKEKLVKVDKEVQKIRASDVKKKDKTNKKTKKSKK